MPFALIVPLTYEPHLPLPSKSTSFEVPCGAVNTEVGTINIPIFQI